MRHAERVTLALLRRQQHNGLSEEAVSEFIPPLKLFILLCLESVQTKLSPQLLAIGAPESLRDRYFIEGETL